MSEIIMAVLTASWLVLLYLSSEWTREAMYE